MMRNLLENVCLITIKTSYQHWSLHYSCMGVETYNLSSSVFITVAFLIFSKWLKLDFMVKFTVGKGVAK